MPRAIANCGNSDSPGDSAATVGRRDTRNWNPLWASGGRLEQPCDEMELAEAPADSRPLRLPLPNETNRCVALGNAAGSRDGGV
jgi:hypothetical protein